MESLSGEHDHLIALERAYLDTVGAWRDLRVRGGGRRLIASVEGIAESEAAAALRGTLLFVPREQAAPLDPDEYYVADLVGMAVVYRMRRRGVVSGVWDSGADTMLEVTLSEGSRCHVPLNRRFVRAVQRGRKRIVLRVDWILQ